MLVYNRASEFETVWLVSIQKKVAINCQPSLYLSHSILKRPSKQLYPPLPPFSNHLETAVVWPCGLLVINLPPSPGKTMPPLSTKNFLSLDRSNPPWDWSRRWNGGTAKCFNWCSFFREVISHWRTLDTYTLVFDRFLFPAPRCEFLALEVEMGRRN